MEEGDRRLLEAIQDAIITRIDALKASQEGLAAEMRGAASRMECKESDDIAEVNRRISTEVERRDAMIAELRQGGIDLQKAVDGMKTWMSRTAIRILTGIIVTLGVPIGTWFIAQTVHLIQTHAGQ